MSDSKKCVRCDRPIDAWARICPFCNQDQAQPVLADAATPAQVSNYVAPDDSLFWKRKLAIAGAGILLLFVAFGVGILINSDDTPKNAPEPVAEKAAGGEPVGVARRADTQLVPMNEAMAQPITSAPVAQPDANIPTEYQRHDATAVSSVEYQQLAARAQAEKKAAAGFVDPRTLTGRAYAQQGQRPRRTLAQATQAAMPSTHPVAEYQPVPSIQVNETTTVRLNLMVGADGTVQDVSMNGSAGRDTPEILSTVRRWRYKPATVNGHAVPAPVTVDISFKANE